MLQSTHFDPVLGLDIHIVTIPMPAPVPVPIPMPFVGMVFDPAGIIMGAAMGMLTGGGPGIVLVNMLPATNCGTDVTNKLTLPHLPLPGVSFVPPPMPANDALLYFGSNQVSLAGSFGVRLGDVALSCSTPVRLPTSVVLAIPKGPPVLNKAPMVPDLNTIGMALAMKGVMKGLGKAARGGAALFRRFRGGALAKRLSKVLGGCVPPNGAGRLRQMWNRAVRFVTGHPVDVVTGNVFTSVTDVELPGPLPLVLERVYESAGSRKASALGHGWNHTLDESLWVERGRAVVRCGDGRELEFPLWELPDRRMRRGDVLESALHKMALRCLGSGRFEVEQPDGRVHEFAPVPGAAPEVARLVRIRSRDGHHGIELTYDERGRLEAVRDCGGRLLYFEHDDRGRLVRLKLPQPQGGGWYVHREYFYDARGDLVEVKDALGKSWRYQYQTHLLVQETDRAGLSFYFQYDGVGSDARCVRTWGDGGIYDHLIHYDVRNKVTVVTNSLGHKTTYFANAMGQVVKVLDPHGASISYEYDDALQKVAEVDPLGNTTRYEYDARGNQVRTVGPDGAAVTVEYDERRLPVHAVDAAGREWRWVHSREGRVVERTMPGGDVSRCGWEQGLLRWVEHVPGRRITLDHDVQKNVTSVTLPTGASQRYEYDSLGRVVSVTAANGGVTRFQYDDEGRVNEARGPDASVQQRVYDPEDNVLESSDGMRRVRFGYGHFHRMIWREEAGDRIQLEYDTEDRLTAVVNEAGERYRYVLDAAGWVQQEIGFDGATRTYLRDKGGHLTRISLPSGRTSERRYDAAGRLVKVKNSDGTFAHFGYDALGQLVLAENESAKVEVERDATGSVTLERTNGREVHSRYGHGGERVEMTTSLGARMVIGRDALGWVRNLRFGPADGVSPEAFVHFERDLTGLESLRRFGNGIDVEWEHDLAGRPLARRTFQQDGWNGQRFLAGAGAPAGTGERREVDALKLQWRGDRLTATVDSSMGPRSFEHDTRGRLTRERRPGAVIEHAMDAAGNVYRTASGQDRRYGKGGRLERDGATVYEHDPDGNQVQRTGPDGTWRYHWNGHGLMTRVDRPDCSRVELEYDAFARRIGKRVRGADGTLLRETTYLWDGPVVIHESDSRQGLVTWQWEPGTLAPVAKEHAGRRWTIATDHLGTPTEMYDELGQLAWKMQLDAFGVPTFKAGGAEDCPWRWPGQYEDPDVGDTYNGWRWYSPQAGLYRSQDPIGMDGGLRQYGYPADPLAQVDPFGQIELDQGGFFLYHIADETGDVVYVGITNNVDARRAQHYASGRLTDDFTLFEVERNLTYAQARGYEQADIRRFGKRDTNRIGEPILPGEPNRIWSYDPARTDDRAKRFLEHERARLAATGGCS